MLVTRGNIPEISIGFFKNENSVTHYRVRGIKWNAKSLDELEELPSEVILDIDMDSVNIYMESELEKHISKALTKEFGYSHDGWKTHCRLSEISKKIESGEEKRINHEIERLLYDVE